MAKVGIIMGSDSDLPVMQDAANVLTQLDVSFEMTIVSAHRTPERMMEYATNAENRGLHVIIAGAGGAAHLPGMVASMTTLPVIGVPIKSKNLNGLDSLLSIVQMPGGIPVATVAIQGARNAGLLAARILSPHDEGLRQRLTAFHQTMHDAVLQKVEKLDTMGYEEYLAANEHAKKV